MPTTLSAAISTSVTKSVLAQLPGDLAEEFNLDDDAVETFLKTWLQKQLTVKTSRKGQGSGRMTGYILFCKENREQIVSENPTLEFGKVGKELGARWRALTPEEKQVWNERAAEMSPSSATPVETPVSRAPVATPTPAPTPAKTAGVKSGKKTGKKAVRA